MTILNAVLTALLLELFVAALLLWPTLLRQTPKGIRDAVRQLYLTHVRSVIQLTPDYSMPDPELTYLLKPGDFVFSNKEFSNRYHVNSLGVRDSEAALEAPEVVVLGDSFTMGWGVEQEQSYAKVLEKLSGLKVLNAGVSSYVSARELALIDRIDTSHMKYLVIEYCDNDIDENQAFANAGNRLIPNAKEYTKDMKDYLADTRYYPFKYAIRVLGIAKSRWKLRKRHPSPEHLMEYADLEADQFLRAIEHGSHKDLGGVQLIVFEIQAYANNDDRFTTALQRRIQHFPYPDFIKRMKVIDLSRSLTAAQYYDLDDHLRSAGHVVIADQLKPWLH